MSTNRDSIRIKRGMSAELPESLPLGELAFCIDTRELWVGSGDGLALKRVTNTEITQHLDEWNALYTEVDERFETKYVDVSAQFSEKFNELCQQFATKSDALDTQFANKYSELSQQFQNKYNNLEREYAQQVHSAMTLSADNKQSIDLLKRDIGTTANIEDLRQLNNQATETLEQLNQVKTELESDVLVIKDIEKDTKKAHIDYEGNHHDSLKDSMDANIDFIKGEFNTTHMTGENITCENTILRHVKQAEMRGHTELNCIKEPSGKEVVLPYEFDETQKDFTLEDTKDTGSLNIVLKGNTEVNVLKNPMRDYVVPYEFEEGYTATLTDTKETGSIQSAILKGNTLVNLMTKCKDVYVVRYNDINNPNNNVANISMMKPNTEYTLFYKAKYRTEGEGSGTNGSLKIATSIEQGFINTAHRYTTEYMKYVYRFTTSSVVDCFVFSTTDKYFAIKECVLLEGDYTQEDIPYFEGMQSVQMPVLSTTGKNLCNRVRGYHSNTGGTQNSWASFDMSCKPNTTYTAKIFSGSNNRFGFFSGVGVAGSVNSYKVTKGNFVEYTGGEKTFTITTGSNDNVMWVYLDNNSIVSLDDVVVQVEESPTATTYEPYKSNILSTPSDLELRGIGGVRDELYLSTGEYVQRISEIVLDGSEEWTMEYAKENTLAFYTYSIPNRKKFGLSISNHFTYSDSSLSSYDYECIKNATAFYINISKTRLSDNSVAGLKQYLQQNPITVQYQLETESIKTVDLSILDQDGLSVPALSTYNEVTYINTTVPENSLKPLISSKTPEFPVMIKPNTKYSIVADTTTNGFDEIPLTYNLGGAEVETSVGEKLTVIQTPRTLENETFKVTGTGMKLSNVMILEKDLTGKEIPNYTEGMQSVKMPVLTTTGKNLLKPNRNSITSIHLKKGTTLILSTKNSIPSLGGNAKFYDIDGNPIWMGIDAGSSSKKFTLPCDIYRIENTLVEGDGLEYQLEVGTVATSYEPYQTNILTVNEPVELRGIGNIKDELNVATGELTQRIGEIVLDGSENWIYEPSYTNDNVYGCYIGLHLLPQKPKPNNFNFANNMFPNITNNSYSQEGFATNPGVLSLRINKNKLDSNDVSGFKKYLQNHPVTLQYPLETESIKTVDFTITNQNGAKVTKLSTFNDVTYISTTVAEGALNPIISHKDLEYEVLLKPNTKYSIITNPISNGHTNSPISFDLGGQQVETTVGSYCTLVTTPNSLTHNKLVMKGRGNKLRGGVMVIEGDKTGMMFNHFDGMKSVEEFTVKVANNNLFNKDYYDWSKYSGGTGQITGIHEYGGRKNCIFTNPTLFPLFTHVKPNKQYTVKFDTLKLDDNGYGFFGVEFHYTDGTREQVSGVWGNEGVWKTSMATSNASKQIKSIKIQNASNGTHGAFIDLDSFVIVEGTSIPQVESRHNSLPLIIPLRSLPNGVSDTLNLVTGEVVQNIGEIVLDGSENWTLDTHNDWQRYRSTIKDMVNIHDYRNPNRTHCDKLVYDVLDVKNSGSYLRVDNQIAIYNDEIVRDVNQFKQWLSQNPITIQYELQEPIVTKLDLAWKDGKLFAYDGKTHIYVDVEGNKLQPMLDIHVPVNIVAELSRLRQEKEQLEISKTQLENQLSLIQYHNSDLVSNVENLVAENLMLKQQTQDLQNNSSVLQLKNRELSKHQEKLRNENLELQKRAKALTHTTENLHHKLHVVDSVREAGDLELLSSDFELDFRLMEIEFALDIPISLSVKGVSSMARTPFEMAKTLILGGKYEREDMEKKLKVYRDRGKITVEEYDELVALMDANELA